MIEILALLEQKTRGNLTAEERQVLEQVLYELRLRFVEASRRRASASSSLSPRTVTRARHAARRTACRRSAATARSAARPIRATGAPVRRS